jgi:hypothetical protein
MRTCKSTCFRAIKKEYIMRKFKKRLALVLATTALASGNAQASNVDATILADNGSIVALETAPGTVSVVPQSVSGNWPRPKSFSFALPDDARALAQCRIHVIAWGDGAVAQGVLAHFQGTAGSNYTGKPGSTLNNVRGSSVTHSGGTAAGLSVANSNPAGILAGLGAPNTQFTSQPAVTGGIPGTWGPVPLAANMDGRSNVVFVWDQPLSNTNGNPNNFRVVSAPCDSVGKAKATTPNDGFPVLPCSDTPGSGEPLDLSTGKPFWRVVPPSGSPTVPVPASNVSWDAVPGANWIGPVGAPTAPGLYQFLARFRLAECPTGQRATVKVQYRADNKAVLVVGSSIVAQQAGTLNYGFLPGSLTSAVHTFPAGTTGVQTVLLRVTNNEGPTGVSANVLVTR